MGLGLWRKKRGQCQHAALGNRYTICRFVRLPASRSRAGETRKIADPGTARLFVPGGFSMKRTFVLAGFLATSLCLWLAGASLAEDRLSQKDKNFLKEAASGGQFEVKLGKIAEEQATSPEVKKFGELMVKDHTALNKLLTDLADSKGLDIPKKMNKKDQEEFEKLSKLNGADFDSRYMKLMVADHVNDVSKFEEMANGASDPDVRAFANKALPVLKDHLQRARQLANRFR
jgi:putative membrane protein